MDDSSLSHRRVTREGSYHRVAEVAWDDPLDGAPALGAGGRWNSPGSFPVVYFNQTVGLARLFGLSKLRGFPYGPEDFDSDTGDLLVTVDLPSQEYVDIVTDEGCKAVGLPPSYPVDGDGHVVPREVCWPIGEAAWLNDEHGIACRSATIGANRSDEELAWFQRGQPLTASRILGFADWFFDAHLA